MNAKQSDNFRVVQMIDSLSLGGAEVMAVNLTNLLSDHDIPALLVASRKGGKAGNRLKPGLPLFVAKKKTAYDIAAFLRLLKQIKGFKPTHIHAHSTSIVWASLLKIFMPRVKLIWHDHNGMREALVMNRNVSLKDVNSFAKSDRLIKLFRSFYHGVIVLNDVSFAFAKQSLKIPEQKIVLLKNFAYPKVTEAYKFEFSNYKNVLMVANVREQKAHDFLLKNIDQVLGANPDWQLLLVGKQWEDDWMKYLMTLHAKLVNQERVLMLGEREDTFDLMRNSDIGLLTSKSEGLPVTLIEYGLAGLPVLASDVGHCRAVLNSEEAVFSYGNGHALVERLNKLMQDEVWRKQEAERIARHIERDYSSSAIFKALLRVYLGSGVANNSEALSPKEQ